MKRVILPILLAATLPAADSGIPAAMNRFTASTFKQVSKGDGNLILSPFNIATALSLLLAGARGQTAKEIQAVLQVHYDSGYDAALAGVVSALSAAGNSEGNELHAANGLWVQKDFAIQPAFEKTLLDQYHAPLIPLDFVAHAEPARLQINQWTADQTKDKIRNLFPPNSLDARTRMVLTSAIYFYGKWQSPFVESKTQPDRFTLPAGAPAQAKFMNQTGHFGYTETPSAQILEIPYLGTGIAFDVLLPKTAAGLAALQASLTSPALTGWLGSLADRNVQVSLPKFRAESQFALAQTLSAMGMPTAFGDKADFSAIHAKGGLQISKVLHKAFVDVSEQGTEAAAATGIAMRTLAVRMPEPPVVFKADHPFLFLIRDTRTGTILFIGRLMNPNS